MHKSSLWLFLVGLAFLVAPLCVLAEPALQGGKVEITSPQMGTEIRGRVPILGSASLPDFQFYKVEFGVGASPSQWNVIGDLHQQPVTDGQLEVWDTTVVPDGVYSLQLQAVRNDGNWVPFFVRGITVANSRPTSTPTPEPTDTPEITSTPYATATPRATATLQIVAPTQALSVATPTPTLSRPRRTSALPIEPRNWLQAFGFGAATVGAVFVLLGLVFGIRRLL
jgi:hypothetical protein